MVKRNIAYGDLLTGAALVALGAYILLASSKWVLFGNEGPGPGFFPLVYGSLMVVLSLYLVQRSIRKGVSETQSSREPAEKGGTAAALMTWAALALSVPLMTVLGFTVGFGLAAFFVVKVIFAQSYRTSLITAACIAGSLHLVFPVLLDAPLPVGMFWGF